jgi:hypothetical protein
MSMRDQIADIIVEELDTESWNATRAADAILAALPDHVRWAAEQWQREVANRPMFNEHRRTLDDTWRQVIRHHGGDDVFLCGPTHDDILAITGETQ